MTHMKTPSDRIALEPNQTHIMKKALILLACLAAICPINSHAQSESARLEKLERAVNQLQKQNAELDQRNAELEQEVTKLKNRAPFAPVITEEKSQPVAGDGKSYVDRGEVTTEKQPIYVTPGGSEIKLTLGGFIQGQVEGGNIDAFQGRFTEGPTATRDRFRLRRARINLTGDFAENFDFKVEGDFALNDTGLTVRDSTGRTLASNTNRLGFDATDVFINWHQVPELNVKVGQYKAPLGYEQLTPDTKLLTIERSQPTNALTPDRQVGVMIWGKPFTNVLPAEKDLVTYYAGIFNGTGRNISTNDNNEFMYVGRLEVQPYKGKLFNQDAFLKFGVNGLTSRDDAGTVVSPAGNLLEAADGQLSAFTLPSAGERDAYGVDAALHIGPFDLSGEYLDERFHPRTVLNVPPTFSGFEANGYYVQGGYFIVPKKLQLVGKWESFNPGQLSSDDINSVTGGVNYYIKGDDIKLMANYIHTWSDFRDANPAFSKSGFDEVLVRLQLVF